MCACARAIFPISRALLADMFGCLLSFFPFSPSFVAVALPAEIRRPLQIARIASHWMFGLFMAAVVMSFVMIFLAPFAVSSHPPPRRQPNPTDDQLSKQRNRRRGRSRVAFVFFRVLPFTLISFLIALFTITASAIATVMFVIFRNVFNSAAPTFNIEAYLGIRMMVYMWIASGFSLFAFILQVAYCCVACCGGRKPPRRLRFKNSAMREKAAASTPSPAEGSHETPVETMTTTTTTTTE